jgi:hypothetical protein
MISLLSGLLKVFLFLNLSVFFTSGTFAQAPLHQERGVALIWYGSQDNLSHRDSIVTTGQIMFMWRDFEPVRGKYAFEELDEELEEISKKGLKTTVQINGNVHPDYLFRIVPYLDGVALPGQKDHTIGYGPLMYWNETYKERYSALVRALSEHLKNSPHKEIILGIRQSYCAVGTEHHFIPHEYRDSSKWTINRRAFWGGSENDWTEETGDNYKEWALDLFIDEFITNAGLNIFMRASAISDGITKERHLRMVERGELWLFHTSSEPQPRNESKNKQYQVFVDYCKTGMTYGFMESWSMANTHSEKWEWTRTDHPITKAQFNYWTLLCNLHCGATFPAMRPEDLDRPEFSEDYLFTRKYAGFLHAPEEAPGTWIAFREGDFLTGDYNYLMERNPNDNGIPVYNADTTKYGLWARKYNEKETCRLKIDRDFMMSLGENPYVKVKIRYLDDNKGTIRLRAFTKFMSFEKEGTGEWKLVELSMKVTNPEPLIDIIALDGSLTLHMVEIERSN